jgi:hypothetical protein
LRLAGADHVEEMAAQVSASANDRISAVFALAERRTLWHLAAASPRQNLPWASSSPNIGISVAENLRCRSSGRQHITPGAGGSSAFSSRRR